MTQQFPHVAVLSVSVYVYSYTWKNPRFPIVHLYFSMAATVCWTYLHATTPNMTLPNGFAVGEQLHWSPGWRIRATHVQARIIGCLLWEALYFAQVIVHVSPTWEHKARELWDGNLVLWRSSRAKAACLVSEEIRGGAGRLHLKVCSRSEVNTYGDKS